MNETFSNKMGVNISIDEFSFSDEIDVFFRNTKLCLNGGDFNFLIGMSGAGKTTLLKIILGIILQNEKIRIKYYIQNRALNCEQVKFLGKIGFISQNPSLVSWKNVKSNLELPCKLNKKLDKPCKERFLKELKSVGLKEEILDRMPHELSFGMQARVVLARTLLYSPHFLFLDELFTGIDTINSNFIAKRLTQFIKENKSVCLSVTHDIDRAVQFADNIYIINASKEVKEIDKPFESQKVIDLISKNL